MAVRQRSSRDVTRARAAEVSDRDVTDLLLKQDTPWTSRLIPSRPNIASNDLGDVRERAGGGGRCISTVA